MIKNWFSFDPTEGLQAPRQIFSRGCWTYAVLWFAQNVYGQTVSHLCELISSPGSRRAITNSQETNTCTEIPYKNQKLANKCYDGFVHIWLLNSTTTSEKLLCESLIIRTGFSSRVAGTQGPATPGWQCLLWPQNHSVQRHRWTQYFETVIEVRGSVITRSNMWERRIRTSLCHTGGYLAKDGMIKAHNKYPWYHR